MKQIGSVLWPKLLVLQIYGANTGVGKTIFSSILCRAFQRSKTNVKYLKPVSTGPLDEADDQHIASLGGGVRSKCLFQFDEPISPHLAVRSAGKTISDAEVLAAVYKELQSYADGNESVALVETAGGVLSPSPSGSSQADLYRPLRIPSLLVGDHKLGGIATTISAWESLHIRGYDVPAIALFKDERYGNYTYLTEYFRDRQVKTFSVPPPPERHASSQEDLKAMQEYYQQSSNSQEVINLVGRFFATHEDRLQALDEMSESAEMFIWHPFMQHSERSKDTIVAWDSAYGDYLQSFTSGGSPAGILDHAYKTAEEQNQRKTAGDRSLLTPAFDGSASWWTQGLGHGNPRLALTAAHAAGRYGHVMFANAIHQPALTLAETVLHNSRNPNLSKIFYSDNGSTGMEVAVKMALRATMEELRLEHTRDLDIRIVGLKNSYHGDTIGTMDCSEPSIYNKKVEWYRGRGIWLDFPTVKMRRGKWLVEPIAGDTSFKTRYFDSLTDIFDFKKRHRERKKYKEYIRTTLWEQMEREGAIPGALIIEPVILGAGGMLFADPLYQRCLVEVAREDDSECWEDSESDIDEDGEYWGDWKGMPVIFDEVFTGLYRLGRFSAASFLGVNPDIVVNAKLLTGGLLPLCTTAASKSIFEAFLSDDKTDALLHGHSYTAHPVGCAVANESLRTMMTLETDGSWESFKKDWVPVAKRPLDLLKRTVAPAWSMWSSTFVAQVSHRKSVDHVFALGTVLAICVKDPGGGGYASTAATGLRDALMAREAGGESNAVVHSRVMGNVLYLMTALTTPVETVRDLEKRVLDVLK